MLQYVLPLARQVKGFLLLNLIGLLSTPNWMTPAMIERAIRIAYSCCEKIETHGDRVHLIGQYSGYKIEMRLNLATEIIGSARPKF